MVRLSCLSNRYGYNGNKRIYSALQMTQSWSSSSFSSNSSSSHETTGKKEALQYLESWVGKGNANDNTISTTSSKPTTKSSISTFSRQDLDMKNEKLTPLYITGSSYLLPTLRIQRTDTPESLSHQIDASLSNSSHASRSSSTMLTGKDIQTSSSSSSSSKCKRWKVPLILDLGSFHPDGSPHYKPPTEELLTGMVQVLKERGIEVLGIANAPMAMGGHSGSAGTTNKSVEEIVSSLGLPPVMSIRSKSSDQEQPYRGMRIEDVIQMVQRKEIEEQNNDIVKQNEPLESKSNVIENDIIEENPEFIESLSKENHINHHATERIPSGATATTDSDVNGTNVHDNQNDTIPPTTAKIYHGNVRTGQQVSAEHNRSLIILGSVHSGGEVMADADIYVYGKLKGRALAGLNGEPTAKILASQFDPELVCVGGIYTTIDDVTDFGLTERGCPALVQADVEKGVLTFQEISL